MLLRRRRLGAWVAGLLLVLAAPGFAAESDVTPPPKADVPFMIHAGNLTETEHLTATEERKKDLVTYVVPGAASAVRTPLAGPEFLLLSAKLDPNALQLYTFEVKNGRRQISFNEKKKKQNPQPHILSVFPVAAGLFKLRVDASLERGEYCMSPDGTNDVFCFAVF
jgi:hypothetical protein